MKTFDYAIVGSGWGSLICAYILSKKDYSVLLLEKKKKFGGCLQSFKLGDVNFDIGFHYVGELHKGGVLDLIFDYLNIKKDVEFIKLDDAYDRFFMGNKEYKIFSSKEKNIEYLGELFPQEKQSIINYYNAIDDYCDKLKMYNLEYIDSEDYMTFLEGLSISSWDVICSHLQNDTLRQIVSFPNILYASPKDSSPWAFHAIITKHFFNGAYRFTSQISDIADSLISSIKKFGAEVYSNSAVESISFIDQENVTIKTADNKFLAKNVISGIHPSQTISLIKDSKLKKPFVRRMKNLDNSPSYVSIHCELKPNTVPYAKYNYYYYNGDNVWCADDEILDNVGNSGVGIFPVGAADKNGFMKAVSFGATAKYSDFKKWENTTVEKRGDDYKAFKQNIADNILKLVAKVYPDMVANISRMSISTPLTFRDYISSVNGGIYGVKRDYKKAYNSIVLSQTTQENLYFTGQNIGVHGMKGVAINSLLTLGNFIDINTIIKEIKKED